MLKFNVTIKGVAPLLFNRYPEEQNQEGKSKKNTAIASKADQAEVSLYRDEDGKIYTPADHIIGSMVQAGSAFKLKGKETYKKVMQGGLFVQPLRIVHDDQTFEIDWRNVVIKATKGRIMKARARKNEWSLSFQIHCIDDRATAKDIQDILEYAGTYIGIGDYRPRYGRFEVTEFTKV